MTTIELPETITEPGQTEALTAPDGAEQVIVTIDVETLTPPGAEFSVSCWRSLINPDQSEDGWDTSLVPVFFINTTGSHRLPVELKTAGRYQLRWNVKPGITVKATAAVSG